MCIRDSSVLIYNWVSWHTGSVRDTELQNHMNTTFSKENTLYSPIRKLHIKMEKLGKIYVKIALKFNKICAKVVRTLYGCGKKIWSEILFTRTHAPSMTRIKQTNTVTALMVFTHICSICTLPNTCRPTHDLPVKVRQWLSGLSHVINIWHWELTNMYYIGLPMRQTPVTAVDVRR